MAYSSVTILVLLAAMLRGAAAQPPATSYDGTWWASQSADQQAHFASGFFDCSHAYPKAQLKGNQYVVAKYVTTFYKSHPASTKKTVAEILLAGGPRDLPVVKGGEVSYGIHAGMDGEYWGMLDVPNRVKFVEGYVVCEQAHGGTAKPENAAGYSAFITTWFDADHGNSRQANERSGVSIASALHRAEQVNITRYLRHARLAKRYSGVQPLAVKSRPTQ